MPPRKKSQSAERETVKYGVGYTHLRGSRMNSLHINYRITTTPLLIQAMNCGVAPGIKDVSPVETATAAALLSTLQENMLVFKNTKNQLIEMKYINSGAVMGICFSLPSSLVSVRQAMMIIKKSITSKVAKRAYKLLIAQDKTHKSDKEKIMNTIAGILNGGAMVTVYGKVQDSGANKKKTDALVTKLKTMLPKKLDSTGKGAESAHEPVKAKDVYREVSLGGSFPIQFLAILTAGMQNSGIDFYTDTSMKTIYINRNHCTAAHLNPLKQFVKSRLRFVINQDFKDEKAAEKKFQKLAELVHQQAAFTVEVQDGMPSLMDASKKIDTFMDNFSAVFNKD